MAGTENPKPITDLVQLMKDLLSFGYSHAPEARMAGGPFKLRRLDGSVVSEEEFEAELNRLLET